MMNSHHVDQNYKSPEESFNEKFNEKSQLQDSKPTDDRKFILSTSSGL